MVGIYSITSPSGKMYIGQSWNIEKRLLSYKRIDCIKQRLIYRSLKKYGPAAHAFDILRGLPEIATQAQLDYWEDHVIRSYRRLGIKMLNIRDGGKGGRMSEESKLRIGASNKGKLKGKICGELNPYFGKKHSADVRIKMSISNRGNKVGARNGRARSVYQYDPQGCFIREFETLTIASKEIGISRQGISDAVNGRNKTAAGFIWKYKSKS